MHFSFVIKTLLYSLVDIKTNVQPFLQVSLMLCLRLKRRCCCVSAICINSAVHSHWSAAVELCCALETNQWASGALDQSQRGAGLTACDAATWLSHAGSAAQDQSAMIVPKNRALACSHWHTHVFTSQRLKMFREEFLLKALEEMNFESYKRYIWWSTE